MIKIIKLFYWSVITSYGRYQLLEYFVRDIPGPYGIEIRSRLYKKYFAEVGENLEILANVRLRNIHHINLGNRVNIGESVMIQAAGELVIGDDVMIGVGSKIWTSNHEFSDINLPIRDQGYLHKRSIIGKGCWIGANSFLMPGVELGDGCIVSAGSVVSGKKYPAFKIISGNPARVIGDRRANAAADSKDNQN